MNFRPLEKVRTIIHQAINLDIMYAYDDLVFSDYGVLLIQFDEKMEHHLRCYFNKDYDQENQKSTIRKLEEASKSYQFTIELIGYFDMEQVDGEIKINFHENVKI